MNRRAAGVLSLALLLAACGRRASTSPGPDGSVPAALSAKPQAVPSSFQLVARFAEQIDTRLHAVGDRPAVWQRNADGAWSLSTLLRDGRIVDLTAGLDKEPAHGDLLLVAGDSPDSVYFSTSFVGPEGAMQFDMSTWQSSAGKKPTRVAPVGLRALGAYHDGHWIGLPFAVHPGYLIDDPPKKFQTIRGKGSLPVIPPKVSLYAVTFLGSGRACGLGAVIGSASVVEVVLWTESGKTFPLGPMTDLEDAAVLRGVNGECVVAVPAKDGTSFTRIRGDALTKVQISRRVVSVAATRDGTLWLVDDTNAVVRIRLREDAAEETVYALPAPVPGCNTLTHGSVVAFADDDVWLLAACRDPAHDVLLHTQTAPASIVSWPPPPGDQAPVR